MASFTSEPLVRVRFQLNDAVVVPSDLVLACVDEAHVELMRFLDPQFDVATPEDAIVMGETLLAGANVYRVLAARCAGERKSVAVGGQRVENGDGFDVLLVMADRLCELGWYILEPYVVDRPGMSPGDVTESTAVLGEE